MKHLSILTIALMVTVFAHAQRGEAEKALQEKYMQQYGQQGMDQLKKMMEAEMKPEYKFPIYVQMHIVDYDGSKKKESDVKFHLNASEKTFAYSGNDMNNGKAATVIMDEKNGTMVMLDDSKKTAMAINLNAFGMGNMNKMGKHTVDKEAYENVKCSKASGTKTVAGYSCQKYECVDKEKGTRGDIWVTDKAPMTMLGKVGEMSPWSMYLTNLGGMSGTMLAGKFYKDDKADSEFEVTELKQNSTHSIKTSGYKKMDMMGR
ncbi:MAG: DUF4412 domain-containing protein [Chitinophagales bacterium]|nr:DUF4412 domain-containing protein [Chitinophagaceae bacterium]MCB9064256.1 DUF4412 domain-containing protein [Chitinophagales bacterium]